MLGKSELSNPVEKHIGGGGHFENAISFEWINMYEETGLHAVSFGGWGMGGVRAGNLTLLGV